MANPANTQEPTMEEILASIRRIISEDGEEPKTAEASKPKPVPPPIAKVAPRPVLQPEPEEADDVLELTDMVEEEPEEPRPAQRSSVVDDDVVMVERTPMKAPRSEPRAPIVSRPRYNSDIDEGLLSEQVRDQASSSFMQLTRTALVSESTDPRSLETLVQDMLRPVLENWLNANLPDIVERLVQQEIDRVSRKGR